MVEDSENPNQYFVSWKLLKTTDGETQTLVAPKMIVLADQDATAFIGDIDNQGQTRSGSEVQIRVTESDGVAVALAVVSHTEDRRRTYFEEKIVAVKGQYLPEK